MDEDAQRTIVARCGQHIPVRVRHQGVGLVLCLVHYNKLLTFKAAAVLTTQATLQIKCDDSAISPESVRVRALSVSAHATRRSSSGFHALADGTQDIAARIP